MTFMAQKMPIYSLLSRFTLVQNNSADMKAGRFAVSPGGVTSANWRIGE
jgi:hypothetical protein